MTTTVPEAMTIRLSTPADQSAIGLLINTIQREEYGIPITLADQPDLADIDAFYRKGSGNFWVAEVRGEVVGTIAILDIGNGQGALRKMFVQLDYRGRSSGIAQALLNTLMAHARDGNFSHVLLGTTSQFIAAHRFYEKNGFTPIAADNLPASFPRMAVDTIFYEYKC